MLSRWVRRWVSALLRPLLTALHRLGVTPSMVTAAGLVAVVGSALAIASGRTGAAGGLLLLGGILDGIDGELARAFDMESDLGGFLDSVADHLGDFAVYLGLFWLSRTRGEAAAEILVLCALFGSLYGSLIRSRGVLVGVDTKEVGWCTRFERVAILLVGLFTERTAAALWVLAAATNLSAAQRLVWVLRRGRTTTG